MSLLKRFGVAMNEHIMVCGFTGTGKSQLAEYLCREYSSIIVLDYKHEVNWEGFTVVHDVKGLSRVGHDEEYNRVIFRVPHSWKIPDYDVFFQWVLRRSNTRVCVDEGMVLGDHGRYPEHLKTLVVVGRSLGCGLIFLCQRPVTIPKFITTNTTHKFVFYLEEDDRGPFARRTKKPILWEDPVKGVAHKSYNFIHVTAGVLGYDGPFCLDLGGE